MKPAEKRFTVSIQVTVLTLMIIISCLTAGLALGLQYSFSRTLAHSAAENAFQATAQRVSERIQALDAQAANLVRTLTPLDQIREPWTPDDKQQALRLLAGAMAQNDSLYAIYMGYSNGDYLELINPESSPNVRATFGAAPHDRWIAITIAGGRPVKTFTYLDQNLVPRAERSEATSYDPRERPWYVEAVENPGVIRTPPYIFAHFGAPGVTYAQELPQGMGVVAVDISLEGLNSFLSRQRLFQDSSTFIFDANGNIVAHSLMQHDPVETIPLSQEEKDFIRSHPVIRASNEMDWPPFDFTLSGKPKGYSIDLLNLLAAKAGFKVEYVNGYTWNELMDMFQRGDLDLLHSLFRSQDRESMGLFSAPYLPMPQALAMRIGEAPPASLDDMRGRIVAIPRGWSTATFLRDEYPDITLLDVDTPLDALRAVSSGQADATMDCKPVLDFLLKTYFIDNVQITLDLPQLTGTGYGNLYFLVQRDMPQLQSILNTALSALTYEERQQLIQAWLGEGNVHVGETVAGTVDDEFLHLAQESDQSSTMWVMDVDGVACFAYAAPIHSSYGLQEYVGFLAPVEEIAGPFMSKVRFSFLITTGLLLLLAPLIWFTTRLIVKPINALVLESDKVKHRRYKQVRQVKSHIKEIITLSGSMVSMAEAIKAHELAQRNLMDSFIRLIASAIDEKSPYTGGHCSRMPQLAAMLAKAASNESTGPFADFHLQGEEQWREFHVAAWLHDCGKVTTPEYIVDKGTKLEAISNRIHEVRTRFEILLRDAEIAYWKGLAQGTADPGELERTLQQEQQQIRDDFAFVAECNLGGESMDPAKMERIKAIARRRWTRNLDDRLGLSHVEAERYPIPAHELPCTEQLLADRTEHVIPRQRPPLLSTMDAQFNMMAPEHFANLGEVYNLCIERGTLTPEDRYNINEHIISTIRMLETLPFPEDLTKVPEYAGAHHETLVGTGYPRGLTAERISMPARILALADVFEALTASDRPYKKAKKLSEAVAIMFTMCRNRHIDMDLFKLFLAKELHLEYARKFLTPDQMDDVDVDAYLT